MSTYTEERTDLRAELRAGLEALHAQIRDGESDDGWALTCINDWRPDLSPFAQALAWEDFTDAVDKLAALRDPMFDPAGLDEDPEVAEHRYEERAEAFITTLMGGAR